MNLQELPPYNDDRHWICPDIGNYWKLAKIRDSDKIVLRSLSGTTQFQLTSSEGFALQHFTGQLTIEQIQQKCQQKFTNAISPNFVGELLQKLISLGILECDASEGGKNWDKKPIIQPSIDRISFSEDWFCPDLTLYWQLSQYPDSDLTILKAISSHLQILFSATEGYALSYFTGEFTVSQIQDLCQQHFGQSISANFMGELLQKLIELNLLELPTSSNTASNSLQLPKSSANHSQRPKLKACVHWLEHPDGYWILRNPEDVTFLQVSDFDKTIIDQLERRASGSIVEEFCISSQYLKQLLQLLAVTAMLEGTTKPLPPKRKFTPMQLLSFRRPLFNPDRFLDRHIDKLRWFWTRSFAFTLLIFLAFSAIIGINQSGEILTAGQQLLMARGGNLLIPFALLSTLVVTLHEFGHAFTLKHYGGIVPEVGLLFVMFVPAAYTNTTDSYCLSRFKRVLVVAAGLMVQFIIWAVALWLWNWTVPGSWLQTTSYLLMTAALVTVAINLNPLAKFDGYYLAVAISGINNLRSRSFGLYGNLLTGKPIQETPGDALFLALYAPFSLVYIWFVFGFLLWRIADWSLTNIPITAFLFLAIWAIYFYFPSKKA